MGAAAVDLLDQDLAPELCAKRGGILLQDAAPPRQRLDDAQVFQLRISLGDGVAVNAKFFRQRPDGGKCLAGSKRSGGRGGLDLVHHLKVDGQAGFEIDEEDHVCATVL